MSTIIHTNGQRGRRRAASALRRLAAVAAVAALVGVGCSPDEILDVEDIDVALPEAVQDAAALPAVLAGAIGNFGVAYNGSFDLNQISLAGLISDEYINTETFPTRIEIDQRRQQYQSNGTLGALFYRTMQARAAADFAAEGFARFADTDAGFAEALNLSGLMYVLIAENYCGGVPISRETSPGTFEFGPALSTRQLLERAVQKADSALAIVGAATAGAGLRNARVARILKARALLNLDRPADASAAIGGTAGVPTTFQYNYTHSELTGRQNNGNWSLVQNSGRFGVGNNEGGNGLPFRSEGDTAQAVSARDPRVPNVRRPTNQGNGFDGATPMWWQLRHPLRAAPAIIADGVEARLIEAEAQLRAGDYPAALVTLNALRSNTALFALPGRQASGSLAPLAPAVGLDAQVNQLFKERAYWLYLTSHRLGDLRRLARPTTAAAGGISGYGRGNEAVFPTGTYHKSGTYGTDVNSPIPQDEDNNPEFDRSTCSTTTP
jgi:starch-binding outer membrane protein, SusD/RagB family